MTTGDETTGESTDHRRLLQQMLLLRRFEERCAELYQQTKIRGFLHLYVGEEAIATGVIGRLRPDDAVFGTYRDHGHALVKGLPAAAVMAEMFGRSAGCSGGRGGSMHLFSAEHHFYGGNAIVAGGLPMAVGRALADRLTGTERVTVCFFGEGAVAEGEFHESMNLAALWRLPVLFACENNLYAMGTALERSEASTDLALRAMSYGMPAWSTDGMDVDAVIESTERALIHLRGGHGPVFIEFPTYRFRAHSMYDPELYRTKDEVALWRGRDPITILGDRMRATGRLDDESFDRLVADVEAEIDDAVAAAEMAPLEPLADIGRHVYADDDRRGHPAPPGTTVDDRPTTEMTCREAMRQAIRDALVEDESVFMMGEDIGAYGGCFAVSLGLLEEFGPERIRDTPLSESAFVGAGIGAAIAGRRPIVEVMTANFAFLALDQIVNNAATLRYMSGGQIGVPLVIRLATGGGRQLAAQHSHSFEGWYAHIAGIKVWVPATADDFRWMLPAALADPDPVLIFEHAGLYATSGPVGDGPGPHPERALVRRPGGDVSLITYGGTLPVTLEAADRLRAEGVEAEVIDLRSLRPLDDETILASVTRTHRAVVVDEGWRSVGIAAEIIARINEQAWYELDAPVGRVCSLEVPAPYAAHLEAATRPTLERIMAAVRAARRGEALDER